MGEEVKADKIYAVRKVNCGTEVLCAFFTTPELAEKWVHSHDESGECIVKEIALDVDKEKLEQGLKACHISMQRDGSHKVYLVGGRHEESVKLDSPFYMSGRKLMYFNTWAMTREEAVERAQAERQRLIASGEWE